MPDLTDLPPTLRPLIERFQGDIDRLMQSLLSGQLTAEGWVRNMEEAISLYHMLALAAGQQDTAVSPEAKERLDNLVGVQTAFLLGFGAVVGATAAGNQMQEMANSFRARARSYALAIKTAWYEGDVIRQAGRPLPLPAMPAQGTQCQNNCGCSWDIMTLDNQGGDFDCFWTRGKNDSCQTCLAREALWNGPGGDHSRPVRIRNGRLMPISDEPPTYKHLSGQHDQASHGRGGGNLHPGDNAPNPAGFAVRPMHHSNHADFQDGRNWKVPNSGVVPLYHDTNAPPESILKNGILSGETGRVFSHQAPPPPSGTIGRYTIEFDANITQGEMYPHGNVRYPAMAYENPSWNSYKTDFTYYGVWSSGTGMDIPAGNISKIYDNQSNSVVFERKE